MKHLLHFTTITAMLCTNFLSSQTITTAVPFLLITPDSRAGGMGEGGVATSADENSIHWNCAKLGFVPHTTGVSISYTPWLRSLVPDINLFYGSFYQRLKKGVIGGSLTYFSLGRITSITSAGTPGQYRPNEFSIDGSYAKRWNERFSAGLALRYIHSNLTQGTFGANYAGGPASAVGIDLGIYYTNYDISLFNRQAFLRAGASITNFGNKMNYHGSAESGFLPCDLRIGASEELNADEHNSVELQLEISKLLVPTPPVYEVNPANGYPVVGPNGNYVIASGKDPNVNAFRGAIQSFYDAPGGFKEELREVTLSTGIEYWYDRKFAVRAGYFYESPTKGDREFVTLGAGVKYNMFGLDFAYLIPVNGQRNPLQNTLRFSLLFALDKKPVMIDP